MGDNDQSDQMNRRLDDQQRVADAELESRRASLAHTRMGIIRSQGLPEWQNPMAPDDSKSSKE